MNVYSMSRSRHIYMPFTKPEVIKLNQPKPKPQPKPEKQAIIPSDTTKQVKMFEQERREPEKVSSPPRSPGVGAIRVPTASTDSRAKQRSESSNTKSSVSNRSKFSQGSFLQRSTLSRACKESSTQKLIKKVHTKTDQISSLKSTHENCEKKLEYLKNELKKETEKNIAKSKKLARLLKQRFFRSGKDTADDL